MKAFNVIWTFYKLTKFKSQFTITFSALWFKRIFLMKLYYINNNFDSKDSIRFIEIFRQNFRLYINLNEISRSSLIVTA